MSDTFVALIHILFWYCLFTQRFEGKFHGFIHQVLFRELT